MRTMRRASKIAQSQAGFSLVELLVAVLILMAGTLAAVNVFASSKALSFATQRHEVAIHMAQGELERLHGLPYTQVGLSRAPDSSARLESNSNNVGFYNGSTTTDSSSFTVKSAFGASPALSEHLVLLDSDPTGSVDPGPSAFSVGKVSGKVYRYITWRSEACGSDSAGRQYCPGTRNTKRLLVAVKMDAPDRHGPNKPVWVASIAIDPDSQPYE
jgi:prepilin-type N-terminal cleavage/methylation domain-containing protein